MPVVAGGTGATTFILSAEIGTSTTTLWSNPPGCGPKRSAAARTSKSRGGVTTPSAPSSGTS